MSRTKNYFVQHAKSNWQECGKNVVNFVLKNVAKTWKNSIFSIQKNMTRTWNISGITSKRMWKERGKHEQFFI